jgi:haloalkane dehalogenase
MSHWWQATFPKGQQTLTIEDANGYPVQLAYGEMGSGPPLILVHGVGVWSYCWRYTIAPLARRFRVICFDSKGSGFSEKPQRPETLGHQVVELARVIEALCDGGDAPPPVIVSESLGALTSLGLAINHPDRVSRLVVMNVPIFPKKLPSWGMQILAHLPLGVIQAVDYLRLPYLLAPVVRQIAAIARRDVVVDPSQITDEEVYWATYPYVEFPGTLTKFAEDLQLALQDIQNNLVGQPSYLQRIQDGLPTIQQPTLILWSDCDRWFPPEDGHRLQQRLPNATLQILPQCGHQAAAGCPELVNRALLDFLDIPSPSGDLEPLDLA